MSEDDDEGGEKGNEEEEKAKEAKKLIRLSKVHPKWIPSVVNPSEV